MPDTTAARAALRRAEYRHREVMGGLSLANLKLQAAGGIITAENERHAALGLPVDPLPYPEDSPVWIEHATEALETALASCDELRQAIKAAQAVVRKLEAGHVT